MAIGIIPTQQIEDELDKTLNEVFHMDTELGIKIAELYMQNPLMKLLLQKTYNRMTKESGE